MLLLEQSNDRLWVFLTLISSSISVMLPLLSSPPLLPGLLMLFKARINVTLLTKYLNCAYLCCIRDSELKTPWL